MITQKQRLKLALLIDKYALASVDMIAAGNSKTSKDNFYKVKRKLSKLLEKVTKP